MYKPRQANLGMDAMSGSSLQELSLAFAERLSEIRQFTHLRIEDSARHMYDQELAGLEVPSCGTPVAVICFVAIGPLSETCIDTSFAFKEKLDTATKSLLSISTLFLQLSVRTLEQHVRDLRAAVSKENAAIPKV